MTVPSPALFPERTKTMDRPVLVSAIAALDEDDVIGTDEGLPWRLPADLARFRQLTWGKPIIMGRVTHEHIGRILPGRLNLVVTRNPGRFGSAGAASSSDLVFAASIGEALELARVRAIADGADELFLIGGAEVFAAGWEWTQRLYLTRIAGRHAGTVRLPWLTERTADWTLVREETHPADARNPIAHRFSVWDRPADQR